MSGRRRGPGQRSRQTAARALGADLPRLHPNPPRAVTVLLAVGLLVVGLSGTVIPISFVDQFITQLGIERVLIDVGIGGGDTFYYLCLLAAPSLLVAGSLLPGI